MHMDSAQHQPERILAIDPGIQYLGAALLEGEELIWYGVKTFPRSKRLSEVRSEVKRYLTKLFNDYQPDVLAVEKPFYAQSLLSRNLCCLTKEIQDWGRWKGLRVHAYLPTAPKAFFCGDRQTKQSLAEAMIEKYPFLRHYLTYLPWRRRYWLHVFDAVGLALLCRHKLTCSNISPCATQGARASERGTY
jgi:Holliday junction resolvasome RuvABC endonuclease subunit